MAETIVNFVLGKLADEFVKEILHLYGVGKQVEQVSHELSWIQAFLKDADKKRIVDERQKKWVKEVRDVAYWIEDVIDTFISEVPEIRPGKREAIKRLFKKFKNLPAIHNLGNEIIKIRAKIQEIKTYKDTYGITNLGEGIGAEIGGPGKHILLPEDEDIVGFKTDREKIVGLLLDNSITRRSVVSIVGAGGLGKTTLAWKAYNCEDVKRQFDLHIWVAISQKFELIDILTKIANQLKIQPPKDLSDVHHLTNLKESLRKKRFLLVLDDIWTNNLWTEIKKVLPDSNNGSRILITTRFLNIAEDADPTSEPYELPFLKEGPSLELLLKKALPDRDANKAYPNDLYDIGKQLAKKCGGLPLALVVLGGLLSKKTANYDAWSKVMQTMNWGIDGERCFAIISTSYEDLPFALKSCFMYLAAFPEDYIIDAPPLLRMWIAERFIPEEENKTLEDTAENFLEDLVQRSMIQVSQRSSDGSIRYFRVHDLLHDLAIQKAKEDNFFVACSETDDLQSCSKMRRLAVHYQGNSPSEDAERFGESMKSAVSNLRSILGFQLMPKLYRHRLLKVLSNMGDTKALKMREIGLDKSKSMSQLRYFEVAFGVKSKDRDIFGKFIGSMRFIQTLDLRQAVNHGDLPDCVWHIKTLRHIMLRKNSSGPPPLVDLRNLQTLTGMRSRESWKTIGLPNLPNVKSLGITPSDDYQWDTIATLLGTLEYLINLDITGNDIPSKLINIRGFPFYQCLRTLRLIDTNEPCGKKIAFDVGVFPIHLTEISLENLQLRKDPMPVLEKLENLKKFYLDEGCAVKKLCCSARGFGRLEELHFTSLYQLEEWKIAEGAMPMLKYLYVMDCTLLCVPLGLQYLSALHELTWNEYPILDTKKNEIRSICKHVPTIHFI